MYRQPDDTTNGYPSSNKELTEILDKLKLTISQLSSPTPDIIIMGDFNFPHVLPDTWQNGLTKPGISGDETNMIQNMQTIVDEFFLEQLIDTSTHQDGNILDLIFTNNKDLLHSFSCDETIYSDHYHVHCKSNYTTEHPIKQEFSLPREDSFENLNFFNEDVNWDMIMQELSDCDWDRIFERCDNHSTMVDTFIESCYNICKKYVPEKKAKQGNTKRIKVPKYRRNLMRRRNKIKKKLAKKKVTSSSRTKLKHELVEIELSLQTDYCKEKTEQENLAVSAIRKNSKHFYAYAKKFSKVRQGIGPLTGPNSESVSCPKKMADILSKQYASVWTSPSRTQPDPPNTPNQTISDINLAPADLENAIDELSNNASPGPDKYPAILLKKCIIIPAYAHMAEIHRQFRNQC